MEGKQVAVFRCQGLKDREYSPVHNLKGLAGNLSATDLQAAAVNLEKLVKGVKKKTPPTKELILRFS